MKIFTILFILLFFVSCGEQNEISVLKNDINDGLSEEHRNEFRRDIVEVTDGVYSGIGFGLASLESNIFYHILTLIIFLINIFLIYLLFQSKSMPNYLIAIIVGGALGNLFDRIYYNAVPDFIDIHIGNFHWFIFNVADIFITLGIIGLILNELLQKGLNSKNV